MKELRWHKPKNGRKKKQISFEWIRRMLYLHTHIHLKLLQHLLRLLTRCQLNDLDWTILLLIAHANMNSNFTSTDYKYCQRMRKTQKIIWTIYMLYGGNDVHCACMIWLQLYTLQPLHCCCLWNTIYISNMMVGRHKRAYFSNGYFCLASTRNSESSIHKELVGALEYDGISISIAGI